MKAVLLLLLAIALAACPRADLDAETFSCVTDVDCGSGWVCDEGVCRNPRGLRKPGPACDPACAPQGKACCDGGCVDVATSPLHCGACGNACSSGQACLAGTCRTEAGRCADGEDDDGDGAIDCADPDCADSVCGGGTCCDGACRNERDGDGCGNGRDDDCDGRVDCADEDCLNQRCRSGLICAEGACRLRCLLDGVIVSEGTRHPTAPCLRCEPDREPFAWSPVPKGRQVEGCSDQSACDGRGGCRRAISEPCGGHGDCATLQCTEGRCAE